jgi:hypothetical protein
MPLEAFLLTWVDETFPITKIFPQGYSNKKILAELIIITKSLINCGKGSLQHKNKVFYYRTYMPTLVLGEESNSKKSISSDFFVYSFNSNNKKVFLLYLTDTNFNKKDIDSLTKKIYEILDEGAFEKHDIKKESARRINFLYDQYKNPETNSGCYIQLNEIKEIKTTTKEKNNNIIEENKNDTSNSLSDNLINTNNLDDTKKGSSSGIMLSKINKSKSQLGSIDINDLTTIKESESDLSIIFKQSLDANLNFSQIKKMKSIKKINIILCSVLFVISLVLISLLFYFYN